MAVTLTRKDICIEYEGCKFFFKPRNLDTVSTVGDVADKGLSGILGHFMTGWEGVNDEDGNPVPFTADVIDLMSIRDANKLGDLLMEVYRVESESEKNS